MMYGRDVLWNDREEKINLTMTKTCPYNMQQFLKAIRNDNL